MQFRQKTCLFFTVLIVFQSLIGYSQSKQDYVWLFGLDKSSSPDDTGYRFDFNYNPFQKVKSNNGLGFDSNNASICDTEGNLLFYTNGCAVLNREAEVMPNGDSLNYDIFMEIFNWDNCAFGFPGAQDIIILPDPGSLTGYYIFHKPVIFEDINGPFLREIWMSYVDMELNEGLGDLSLENIILNDSDTPLTSYLTAINHSNNTDWWLLQPLINDSLIVSYLIDDSGVTLVGHQNSKEYFSGDRTSASGTAKFSPDGSKYALYSYYNNLHVYDFDRETGILSNHQEIIIYDDIDFSDIRFNSVEWSPNSQFIYVAARDDLFQVDMSLEDPQEGVELIDSYNGTLDPLPTTFFLMAQAPDCKIYMCPTNGTDSYHVINNPNEKGQECGFIQNGVRLPQTSGAGSFPNFPRYRVDDEAKCDPTISSFVIDEKVNDQILKL